MTPPLDEDLVHRVHDLGPTVWSGSAHRYTAAGRDPLSGAGARLFGGRWNPPEAFATIYLSQPVTACLAELDTHRRGGRSRPGFDASPRTEPA